LWPAEWRRLRDRPIGIAAVVAQAHGVLRRGQ
jgi:hypothetical protein